MRASILVVVLATIAGSLAQQQSFKANNGQQPVRSTNNKNGRPRQALTASPRRAGGKLRIELKGHGPCGPTTGPKAENELIRFPSFRDSQTKQSADGSCFAITNGKLKILNEGIKDIRQFQTFTQMRLNRPDGDAEKCINADDKNCGGVGSCFHCNLCSNSTQYASNVRLVQGSAPVDCNTAYSLGAGDYDDFSLVTCLPSRREFLSLLDDDPAIARQTWQQFMRKTRAQPGIGLPIYMYTYIYDRPVAHVAKNRPNVWQNYFRTQKNNMIGCHWTLATVYDASVN